MGLLLIGANLRTAITSVGPVIPEIRDDLLLPSSVAAVLISVPLLAFALVSPLAPGLAARIGLDRSLALGLLGLAAGIVLRSIPWEPGLWLGTALLGSAVAVLNVLLPALVKRDRPDRIGPYTGLYSSVQGGAAAIAAGLAVPLSSTTDAGWRLGLGVWAGLALVAFAVFLPRLVRRSPVPDSVVLSSATTPARSPWRSPLGWQVSIFMGMQSTVFFSLATWLPTLEADAGFTAAEAGLHLFVMNVCGIPGSLMMAAVIHRMPDQRLIAAVTSVTCAVGVVGLMLLPQFALLWVCVMGFSCGATIVLGLSLFGLRSVDHRQAAALSGMGQSVGYLIASVGPPLMGALHDVTGTWVPVLAALLVALAVQFTTGQLAGRRRVIG